MATAEHYRAYTPKPFTRAERDSTTILFGARHWRLERVSCMPNTMSIGAMAGVPGKHPDILYAPLEIKGDAEVHALSRCQMILTEAKKRAQRELDDMLARTGLTPGDVRAHLDAHPEMKGATYRVPPAGVAGVAADLVLHVAARTGRRAAA